MIRLTRRAGWIGAATALCGLLTMPAAWARWIGPTQMPVARLLQNVQAYIKAHPKEEQGYYTLGRINSAAFAQDKETVGVMPREPLPLVSTQQGLIPAHRDRTKPLPVRAISYAADAIRNYKIATDLNPADGLAWLGLGFQCEEALPFPQVVETGWKRLSLSGAPDPEKMRQEALRFYRKAYALTIQEDTKRPAVMINPVSMEAAEGIIRLQQKRSLSRTEQTELEEMQKQVEIFKKRPRAISPILISFERHASLPDLLAPGKHVRFDLAGDGLGRQWPWVKPTTGILVWDPQHTGKITSGLQLFGNVTWWLFWKDGYGPLAGLDNNHNGWLEGTELQGISVWFDRNSNGISDRGEIVSLSSLGIQRIAAHSAGSADGVPANPEGVQLRDGSSLATFDWTPTSLR